MNLRELASGPAVGLGQHCKELALRALVDGYGHQLAIFVENKRSRNAVDVVLVLCTGLVVGIDMEQLGDFSPSSNKTGG